MGISRATTFPVQNLQASSAQRTSLDGNRFQVNTASNPNLRQTYNELVSRSAEMSPMGTPNSSSPHDGLPRYLMAPQFGTNDAVPDLGAMMFPSNDPFAYPNQPMMEYENIKQQNLGLMNGAQMPPMYMSNGAPGRMYDDLEGQLFGPLPPYLSQTQNSYDIQVPMNNGMMNGQGMGYNPGVQTNEEMNFDGIFSGDGDDWNNMLADQRFK